MRPKKQVVIKWTSRVVRPFAHVYYYLRYSAYPNPFSYIEIDVQDIKGWYRGDLYSELSFPGQIKRGDWRTKVTGRDQFIEYNPKYRAVRQRYVEGLPWRKTVLFEKYAKHLPRKALPKGAKDIDELERIYENRYDPLFKALKENGFSPPGPGVGPVYVCIDRGGELYYTVNGNHRLAMAMVLGIRRIPAIVLRRHKDWQLRRDQLCRRIRDAKDDQSVSIEAQHCDLADLRKRCRGAKSGGPRS